MRVAPYRQEPSECHTHWLRPGSGAGRVWLEGPEILGWGGVGTIDKGGGGAYQIGGCRSFQGRASSSWADREIRVLSSPIRPASITPIGRPSSLQYSGTFTAGRPVTL